jgi:hypothetical protein
VEADRERGDVWVRCSDITSAANCQRALTGRWFAGQKITAEITHDVKEHVGKARIQ